MPPKLIEFLQRWIITTVAVLIAAAMLKGVHYDNSMGLFAATLLLGLLNAFLRPLIILATVGIIGALNFALGLRVALVTLPLQILSFGFLLLAINAGLLLLVSEFVPAFHCDGFWTAFKGGLIISIISLLLNSLTGSGNARIQWQRGQPRPPRSGNRSSGSDNDGNGPVIDV